MNPSPTIQHIRFFEATSPLSHTIADATHQLSTIRFLVTEIELTSGITGQGYLLAFHYFPQALAGALRDLATFARGYAVFETVRLAQDFNHESEYLGQEGLLRWAQASLNLAMWDAWGKVNELPVWKMLGACRNRVPVYGSGGWLSYSNDELLAEVRDYCARGFSAVKIKVGAKEPGRDMERLRLVREAVGPEVKIMMDANQGLDVPTATELAHQAATLGIHWFEEPLHHQNYDGYATLRSKTDIALAMGEREYNTEALKQLITRNALDLWQPDILRLGGVEAWRDSAALAHAHHLPVLPHYYKDYDVPLLCTIPNAYGAESFDWIDGLIDRPMKVENGQAFAREEPGWGFSFLPKHLTEI